MASVMGKDAVAAIRRQRVPECRVQNRTAAYAEPTDASRAEGPAGKVRRFVVG